MLVLVIIAIGGCAWLAWWLLTSASRQLDRSETQAMRRHQAQMRALRPPRSLP